MPFFPFYSLDELDAQLAEQHAGLSADEVKEIRRSVPLSQRAAGKIMMQHRLDASPNRRLRALASYISTAAKNSIRLVGPIDLPSDLQTLVTDLKRDLT